jgi:hypothetical protein
MSASLPTERRIQIIRRVARISGAGWVALTLRELARTEGTCPIDTLDLSEVAHQSDGLVRASIVGLDPSEGIEPVAKFLQQHRSDRAIHFVSSTGLPGDVAVLMRQCGAAGIIESIDSAKLAARTIGRFFSLWPLSAHAPLLQQLPWRPFATEAT